MSTNTVAWEGKFGDADLKIEIPPSGRIHAEWKTPAGTRQKVVDSIEQLERSVLFQLMVGSNVTEETAEEVADAVALTLANRTPLAGYDPVKAKAQPARNKRRKPGGGARRGGGGRPRRRR